MKKKKKDLETWNKYKRFEKIKMLKENWRTEKEGKRITSTAELVGAPDNSQVYLNTENKCCKKIQINHKIESQKR